MKKKGPEIVHAVLTSLQEIKEFDVYQCPNCSSIYSDEHDAIRCCSHHKRDAIIAFGCPDCKSLYEDKDDARTCCGGKHDE